MYALDYEEDRHYFISHYFRDTYDRSLETYPYINSPVQITRIEVWVTNRGYQTQNVRNIIALQDLGEANPARTSLGQRVSNFFSVSDPNAPPHNEVNRLDPDEIGLDGLLTDAVRDIATVKQDFKELKSVKDTITQFWKVQENQSNRNTVTTRNGLYFIKSALE